MMVLPKQSSDILPKVFALAFLCVDYFACVNYLGAVKKLEIIVLMTGKKQTTSALTVNNSQPRIERKCKGRSQCQYPTRKTSFLNKLTISLTKMKRTTMKVIDHADSFNFHALALYITIIEMNRSSIENLTNILKLIKQ